MVKEIDGYKEEQAREERKRKKLEAWLEVTSGVFQKPLYRIVNHCNCIDPHYSVHFEEPNKFLSESQALLTKTDSKDREWYNFLVDRVNGFSGFYPAVTLNPLEDSISMSYPEVYKDARKLAEELEKRFKVEVSLRTTYPKE